MTPERRKLIDIFLRDVEEYVKVQKARYNSLPDDHPMKKIIWDEVIKDGW